MGGFSEFFKDGLFSAIVALSVGVLLVALGFRYLSSSSERVLLVLSTRANDSLSGMR
jgi:hypothetical protein